MTLTRYATSCPHCFALELNRHLDDTKWEAVTVLSDLIAEYCMETEEDDED